MSPWAHEARTGLSFFVACGLGLLVSGCWSSPPLEGLQCDSIRPCPRGLFCTAAGTCSPGPDPVDGGCTEASCLTDADTGSPADAGGVSPAQDGSEDAASVPADAGARDAAPDASRPDASSEDGGLAPPRDAGAPSCAPLTACGPFGECDDGNACTTETCNLTSGCCEVALALAGTPCDDDRQICTLDACDGAGQCTHFFEGPGLVCAPRLDECDVEEVCPGDAFCPANVTLPDGASCSLGQCFAGFCLPDDRQGLVGYLKFDEAAGDVAYDAVQNGYAAALENGPARIVGHLGGALRFDQVDDHAALPDVDYGSQFSLSFWFFALDSSRGVYQIMYSHGAGSEANRIEIYFHPTGNVMTFLADEDRASVFMTTGVPFADGRWHLYTLTYRAGEGAQMYIDGSPWARSVDVTGAINPATPVILGVRTDFADTHRFSGGLDDLRIYARAMVANEVIALYRASAGTDRVFLVPEADAYVQGGPSADVNFGTLNNLLVKWGAEGSEFHREAFVRFDLTGLPIHASASLELTVANTGDITAPVENALLVMDDAWSETGVTYANRPLSGVEIASFQVPEIGQTIELDVSDAVSTASGRLTIGIQSPFDQGGPAIVTYGSRESSRSTSRLYLTF